MKRSTYLLAALALAMVASGCVAYGDYDDGYYYRDGYGYYPSYGYYGYYGHRGDYDRYYGKHHHEREHERFKGRYEPRWDAQPRISRMYPMPNQEHRRLHNDVRRGRGAEHRELNERNRGRHDRD